jgi:hypothetical protein
MANIGTIAVRFYANVGKRFEDRVDNELDEVDVLRLLLEDRFSYCVPIHMDYGDFWWYFDVQYGARYAASNAVQNVIEKYGHLFDRTWVRSSDGGDDIDYIVAWDEEIARKCRYGIDRIKIYAPEPPDKNWIADGDGWILVIGGSYQTLNCRSSLGQRICPISTLTTPTSYEIATLYELMPEAFANVYATLSKERYRIEYIWQDRIVHVSFPSKQEGSYDYVEYSLDSWDNCVDPEYLNYHEQMRNIFFTHFMEK